MRRPLLPAAALSLALLGAAGCATPAPLGAAAGTTGGRRIHHRIEYGILSMAAFAWGL